jgi:hypothetical protein
MKIFVEQSKYRAGLQSGLLSLHTYSISPIAIRICAGISTGLLFVNDLDCNSKRLTTPFDPFQVDDAMPAVPHTLAFDNSPTIIMLVDQAYGRLYVPHTNG